MEIRQLTTVPEVIATLGGNKSFAKLISHGDKQRTDQHVSNYRRIGFPPDCYAVVTEKLKEVGYSAPYKLFKQVPPKPKWRVPVRRSA